MTLVFCAHCGWKLQLRYAADSASYWVHFATRAAQCPKAATYAEPRVQSEHEDEDEADNA